MNFKSLSLLTLFLSQTSGAAIITDLPSSRMEELSRKLDPAVIAAHKNALEEQSNERASVAIEMFQKSEDVSGAIKKIQKDIEDGGQNAGAILGSPKAQMLRINCSYNGCAQIYLVTQEMEKDYIYSKIKYRPNRMVIGAVVVVNKGVAKRIKLVDPFLLNFAMSPEIDDAKAEATKSIIHQ